MAILTNQQRKQVWAEFMQKLSALLEQLNISKSELRDAVNATDQWIEDNSNSFNTAIPQPARAEMTSSQKTRLFMAVAAKRFGVL